MDEQEPTHDTERRKHESCFWESNLFLLLDTTYQEIPPCLFVDLPVTSIVAGLDLLHLANFRTKIIM